MANILTHRLAADHSIIEFHKDIKMQGITKMKKSFRISFKPHRFPGLIQDVYWLLTFIDPTRRYFNPYVTFEVTEQDLNDIDQSILPTMQKYNLPMQSKYWLQTTTIYDKPLPYDKWTGDQLRHLNRSLVLLNNANLGLRLSLEDITFHNNLPVILNLHTVRFFPNVDSSNSSLSLFQKYGLPIEETVTSYVEDYIKFRNRLIRHLDNYNANTPYIPLSVSYDTFEETNNVNTMIMENI